MPIEESPLESNRKQSVPAFPSYLQDISSFSLKPSFEQVSCLEDIKKLFPSISGLPLLLKGNHQTKNRESRKKIGVVFSGGQASGGHNVIAGLFDALTQQGGELIGFLGGPSGIIKKNYKILSKKEIFAFRNTGGFDLLGSGRTKIETEEQLQSALTTCQELCLDGLVIIGGDDSNTNAAVLAEYFHQNTCKTCVVGVPKTIDGDLKNSYVSVSFGFDSATRVYSELIGNLARDALSAKKYYHFVRLMGRSASHITLECALATHPNFALIAEEVAAKQMTFKAIVQDLCNLIIARNKQGKSYGIVLIPEGLLEFTPDVSSLIQELNEILSKGDFSLDLLSSASQECFLSFPEAIQKQLLLARDPHGNVQLSLIETERLLAEMVYQEMQSRGVKDFYPLSHFFGYEGRSGFPSRFDSSYCYTLGLTAALLVSNQASGYMCFVSNLHKPVSEWDIGGVPLASLMRMELRKGKNKPVIEKALVDLQGNAFKTFSNVREGWKEEDCYAFPGPIQLSELGSMEIPISLRLEKGVF